MDGHQTLDPSHGQDEDAADSTTEGDLFGPHVHEIDPIMLDEGHLVNAINLVQADAIVVFAYDDQTTKRRSHIFIRLSFSKVNEFYFLSIILVNLNS